jgi:hypothetical protein
MNKSKGEKIKSKRVRPGARKSKAARRRKGLRSPFLALLSRMVGGMVLCYRTVQEIVRIFGKIIA